ncbi:MAG: hypothetical protein WC662_00530 [Candidatus Paceibacterota bacterium]|jgi:hypothetical protein
MITNTIVAASDFPRRNIWPLKYLSEERMITSRQRQTLTEIICANFQEEERERRLLLLEDMTAIEATDAIYDYSVGRWE